MIKNGNVIGKLIFFFNFKYANMKYKMKPAFFKQRSELNRLLHWKVIVSSFWAPVITRGPVVGTMYPELSLSVLSTTLSELPQSNDLFLLCYLVLVEGQKWLVDV